MWARKRIDIKTSDLITALGYCVFPRPTQTSSTKIARCFKSNRTFTCFSVRSGFDLLLKTTDWVPGSEVIFSGLTIGDMPRIAQAHNLKVVGADIDWKTLAPSVDEIESKITPQTRAIVVAHLMGGRCDLVAIADLARRNNLMLIEDCAQSYVGNQHQGSPLADVSMFSFGSIKTNTALGGAVFVIRDRVLRTAMVENHADWPIQSRFTYFTRVWKYGFVKTISTWPFAASIRFSFRAIGRNHDSMAAGMAKGFAGPDFLTRIRHRPSAALLSVLSRKIERFNPAVIQRRRARGEHLTRVISGVNGKIMPLGIQAVDSTHWVFGIMVENPQELTQQLWDLGFDATTYSSLKLVLTANEHASASDSSNASESTKELPSAERILRQIVFLPTDFPMPDRELERLGKAVASFGRPIEDFTAKPQIHEPCGISVINSDSDVLFGRTS